MDEPKKPEAVGRKSLTVPVSQELQELIRSVSREWQMTEGEAVEELLFLVLYLRRIILAGTRTQEIKTEERPARETPPQEVVKSRFDRIGVITALAFGLGALLAVVYVLLTKR